MDFSGRRSLGPLDGTPIVMLICIQVMHNLHHLEGPRA